MEDFKEIKDAVKTAFDSPPATSKKNQKLYYDDNSNEFQYIYNFIAIFWPQSEVHSMNVGVSLGYGPILSWLRIMQTYNI